MFYHSESNSFYLKNKEGCIQISDELHAHLIKESSNGKVIVSDSDGNPTLEDAPTPSQSDIIKSQISDLEQKITQRRLRDAILTQDGDVWLSDIEHQINQLRSQL